MVKVTHDGPLCPDNQPCTCTASSVRWIVKPKLDKAERHTVGLMLLACATSFVGGFILHLLVSHL